MVRLFLVRHGQASFHAADYDLLSDAGAAQARLLGEWFDHCGWSVHPMVAGAMKRHYQTAEGFFSAYPQAVNWHERLGRDSGFNEFDHKDILNRWFAAEEPEALDRGVRFGDMAPAEFNVKMSAALTRWAEGRHNDDYAEPWPAFSKRCISALHDAAALAQTGENVIVFTSCGVISAVCRSILGISAERMVHLMWEINNASVTCITRRGDDRYSLSAFNATAHLDRARNPELITLK